MTSFSPLAGDLHVNRPLTDFAQFWAQSENSFIGMRAAPNLPVAKQSDLYWVYNRGDWFRDDAAVRADGTETVGTGYALSTAPYFANVTGIHHDVTDRQRANQGPGLDIDSNAAKIVMQKLMISRERTFTSKFFGSGIWGTTVTGVASGATAGQFNKWSGSGSDPVQDIITAIETVQEKTGHRPNKMVIGRKAYNALLTNDAILARISGGATTTVPALVMRTLLAQLFELDEIYVSESVFNSANQGATESTTFIAGANALVYYAPNTVSLGEPTAMVQFSWTGYMGATPSGFRIKKFRMEHIAADRIEGEMAFDYKVVAPELGYFFSGCV